MSLILKSFFFDQTGCQCPANGRMVLSNFSIIWAHNLSSGADFVPSLLCVSWLEWLQKRYSRQTRFRTISVIDHFKYNTITYGDHWDIIRTRNDKTLSLYTFKFRRWQCAFFVYWNYLIKKIRYAKKAHHTLQIKNNSIAFLCIIPVLYEGCRWITNAMWLCTL